MSSPLSTASAQTTVSQRAELSRFHSRSPHILLAANVAIAFVVRVFSIVISQTYKIPAFPDGHFYFGYETGRIARSIALGQGFSSPFHGVTGPTAWLAPIYPYIAAGMFKVFGIYTARSAFVLLALNALFSALTCIPIFFIARRIFGTRVAWWSCWAWALVTPLTYWSVHWVWETSLSTLLVTCIVLLTLDLSDSPLLRTWLFFGLLWGVAALTNPSLLSLLPCFGIWACWRGHIHSRPWLLSAVASALVFFAVISPWIVRNFRVFHRIILVRDNFGVELRLGNGPGAEGIWMEWLHPTQNAVEFRNYEALGELTYVDRRGEEAVSFIRNNPGTFASLCAKRFVYFWAGTPRPVNWKTGAESWKNVASLLEFRNSGYLALSALAFWGLALALRRGTPSTFVLAASLSVYPLVYYAVFPHPRYRHPIEPMMVMLAAFLISQTSTFRRRGVLLAIGSQHPHNTNSSDHQPHLVRSPK